MALSKEQKKQMALANQETAFAAEAAMFRMAEYDAVMTDALKSESMMFKNAEFDVELSQSLRAAKMMFKHAEQERGMEMGLKAMRAMFADCDNDTNDAVWLQGFAQMLKMPEEAAVPASKSMAMSGARMPALAF